MGDNVVIYADMGGKWRWRRVARNGRIVSDSGQGYVFKQSAKRAARRECPGVEITVMPVLEPHEFHVQFGWTAKRLDDGTVRLRVYKDARCEELDREVAIDPSAWASVVAHVSQFGETGQTYRAALDFHGNPKEATHG